MPDQFALEKNIDGTITVYLSGKLSADQSAILLEKYGGTIFVADLFCVGNYL